MTLDDLLFAAVQKARAGARLHDLLIPSDWQVVEEVMREHADEIENLTGKAAP